MSVILKSIQSTIPIYITLAMPYFCILIWCDYSVDKIFTSLSTEKSNYGTKNCLRSVYDMVVTNDRNKEQKNIYMG